MNNNKSFVIIGAGPAGLTAAYEILTRIKDAKVTVLEETDIVGGISRTVVHNGNRMDMGGHRFFSKIARVNEWWEHMLPMQGAVSYDDRILERSIPLAPNGPNPDATDRVMLIRHRVSRILFNGKFYDYPISLKKETIMNMGVFTTLKVGLSYLMSVIFRRPDNNLENFYINRFGKSLYRMFFEYYTENLWGRHPRSIDASWGAQRVKGISILAILKDIIGKATNKKNRKVETSLIEEFKYPKLGPGELWEITAQEVTKLGGNIVFNAKVESLHRDNNKITSVSYSKDGQNNAIECDYVFSSMPLKDLVNGINDVPEDINAIATGLPYRDYMTIGILVNKLNLKNQTEMKTLGNIVPDCWVYVQDRNVKMGRFQIYNNWSPYMVKNPENKIWLGLEYFVQEGDEFWTMADADFSKFAVEEMIKLNLISSPDEVEDTHVERVKKAYPAYFDTYSEIDKVRDYLDSIENIFCIGRNGQHRYNNIDHSMCTAFEAVDNIISGRKDKKNIWSVNTEQDYHEEK